MDCVFCSWLNGKQDEYKQDTDIVYEDDVLVSFVSPKTWPMNVGNVIVIPKYHWTSIYDIPVEVHRSIYDEVQRIALAMKPAYGCTGVSTRQHNDPDGNQDVPHFHAHVIPRYHQDNLYLNHNNSRFVPAEERAYYVNLLK